MRPFAAAVWLRPFALAAVLALAACAHPARQAMPRDSGHWSGRLALQVEDDARQSFSASFELHGDAGTGGLSLQTPLGGTVAELAWAPGRAVLRADGKETRFASVDELVEQATGTAIPVAALFEWLQGRPAAVPGWQADLAERANGRLTARRETPPPVRLRIVLDSESR